MDTYKLRKGFKPGAYGSKRVLLEETGNRLSDAAAEELEAVVEPETAPKAAKKKRATRKKKGA